MAECFIIYSHVLETQPYSASLEQCNKLLGKIYLTFHCSVIFSSAIATALVAPHLAKTHASVKLSRMQLEIFGIHIDNGGIDPGKSQSRLEDKQQ